MNSVKCIRTFLVELLGVVKVNELLEPLLCFQDSLTLGNVQVVLRQTNQRSNQSVSIRLENQEKLMSRLGSILDSFTNLYIAFEKSSVD